MMIKCRQGTRREPDGTVIDTFSIFNFDTYPTTTVLLTRAEVLQVVSEMVKNGFVREVLAAYYTTTESAGG